MSSGKSKAEIAQEILSYFLRNPDSADSLEGVARWRLLEEAVHRSVGETEAALDKLVAEGFVEQVSIEGGEPVFRLNRSNRAQAEKFLRDSSEKRHKSNSE